MSGHMSRVWSIHMALSKVFGQEIAVLGMVKFGRRPSTVRLSTSALNNGIFNRLKYFTHPPPSITYHQRTPRPLRAPARPKPLNMHRHPLTPRYHLLLGRRFLSLTSHRRFLPTAVARAPPPSLIIHRRQFTHLASLSCLANLVFSVVELLPCTAGSAPAFWNPRTTPFLRSPAIKCLPSATAPSSSRSELIAQQQHLSASACRPRALVDAVALPTPPHLAPPRTAGAGVVPGRPFRTLATARHAKSGPINLTHIATLSSMTFANLPLPSTSLPWFHDDFSTSSLQLVIAASTAVSIHPPLFVDFAAVVESYRRRRILFLPSLITTASQTHHPAELYQYISGYPHCSSIHRLQLATVDAAIINFNAVIASTAVAVAFPTIVVAFTTAVVAFTTAVVALSPSSQHHHAQTTLSLTTVPTAADTSNARRRRFRRRRRYPEHYPHTQ
ncbi:hypothetical protein R3P38DRAFT_3473254 [Favolaschia claudopus]|uniref:Uncharacterized protein n=1 Tax=Favolaschia claudopus TaxID=2862362 RepID=A0AAV9ZBA4_9AGAR